MYQSSIVVNDFIIPHKNQNTQEHQRGQHFYIWFLPEPKDWGLEADKVGYYVKDLGVGYGVFKKMDIIRT